MYEWCDENWFQVNYSRLSAFYKTITFTKVPLSWVRWVHLFISLRIFCLSSFLPLTFHSLTESLKRPSNYRQTVLIDSGGNYTGVREDYEIWGAFDCGMEEKGAPISQRMSCCGQVVDWASGQLIDPRIWPADRSETLRGVSQLAVLWLECWCFITVKLGLVFWPGDGKPLPEMCRCVCALSRLHVGMFVSILAPTPGSPSLPLSQRRIGFGLGHCLATDAFWLVSTVSSLWSAVIVHNEDGPSPVGVRRKCTHGSYQLDWWLAGSVSFCTFSLGPPQFLLSYPSVSFKSSLGFQFFVISPFCFLTLPHFPVWFTSSSLPRSL